MIEHELDRAAAGPVFELAELVESDRAARGAAHTFIERERTAP